MTTADDCVRLAIRLAVPLASRRDPQRVHPVGTEGSLVEVLGVDAWLVELRIADDALVGGAWYEVFEVRPNEFEFVDATDDATQSGGTR